MTPRSFRFALLIAALAAGNGQAQNPLSLDAALTLAQERSQQLVAQGAAASAARDMAHAAGQLPDPTLEAGINNLPVEHEYVKLH